MAAGFAAFLAAQPKDKPLFVFVLTSTNHPPYDLPADYQRVPRAVAAMPKDLLESELFGHERGAFTGAQNMRRGRFEQAEGGTLFLDEIGDMPLPLQVRLLSVIEDREVIPLGGSKSIPVDIRIISATHCDLLQQVRERRFREDLYYRLNGLALQLPALRERSDLDALVTRLLRELEPQLARLEACGKTIPCRIGTRRLVEVADRIVDGRPRPNDPQLLEDLSAACWPPTRSGPTTPARSH